MMKCKCPIDVMKITTVIRIMRVFVCVNEVNKLTALINSWDNLYNWFDWIKQRDLEYRQTLRNAP